MTQHACIISSLHLEFPTRIIFTDLNFSLFKGKVSALIGRNGQGKSLLLNLLHSHLDSRSSLDFDCHGQILWQMKHAYLDQFQRCTGDCIADALDVLPLHLAFERIQQNIATDSDYLLVENQWQQPQLWQQLLSSADLPVDLNFKIESLSEGQKTKLSLVKLLLKTDHYLLLDEPANHLDTKSRAWLLKALQHHPAGALIISHDKTTLGQAEHIYHLSENGLTHTDGGFEIYSSQREKQISALSASIEQEKRDLKKLKSRQQDSVMKAKKREKSGQKLRSSASQSKMILDSKKESAGQSLAGLLNQQKRQLQQGEQSLKDKQSVLEIIQPQDFEFPHIDVSIREILRIRQLILPYGSRSPINFALTAREKSRLVGNNGTGKSTLLKMINQQDQSRHPDIYLNARCFYLDQNFNCLDPDKNAIENLIQFNPHLTATTWRQLLGNLRLRGEKGLLKIHQLSGGERLKVLLTGIAQLNPLPELLLLDEPDNHLDLESKDLLAKAIASWQGAMILVSHDDAFVDTCGIHTQLKLS